MSLVGFRISISCRNHGLNPVGEQDREFVEVKLTNTAPKLI
jgi:hypothetical protein